MWPFAHSDGEYCLSVRSMTAVFVLAGMVGIIDFRDDSSAVAAESPSGKQQVRAQTLECIQDALGGVQALSRIASLRILGETKPASTSGLRSLPGSREIRLVFPDRYQRIDIGRPPGAAGATLNSVIGFDRTQLLSSPRVRDAAEAMRAARWDFEIQTWMRLPRLAKGTRVARRAMPGSPSRQFALEISTMDGFRASLQADTLSCTPTALEYRTTIYPQSTTTRVTLAAYRAFGDIRFPTVLTTWAGAEPSSIETVSTVELNAPNSKRYFVPER